MPIDIAINMAGALRRCLRSYTSTADASSWLAQGLNFKCTQCGKCCTGGRERAVWVRGVMAKEVLWQVSESSTSIVAAALQVTGQEANAIAGSLGLDGEEFADQYLQACATSSKKFAAKHTLQHASHTNQQITSKRAPRDSCMFCRVVP